MVWLQLACGLMAIFIGALTATLILIPPFRKLSFQKRSVRFASIIFLSTLSFFISLLVYSRLWVNVIYLNHIDLPRELPSLDFPKETIDELQWQFIIPDSTFLYRDCFSKTAVVCENAGTIIEHSGSPKFGVEYFGLILTLCFITALSCGSLVFFYTVEQKKILFEDE